MAIDTLEIPDLADPNVKRQYLEEQRRSSEEFTATNAEKWFNQLDDLPQTQADIDLIVKSELNQPEKMVQFKTRVLDNFFGNKSPRLRYEYESGLPAAVQMFDKGVKDFAEQERDKWYWEHYNAANQKFSEQRKKLTTAAGEYIRRGGQEAGKEEPWTMTEEQKALADAGKPWMPTYEQALAETKRTGAFKEIDDETLIDKWGLEGKEFQQLDDLTTAMNAEENPQMKAFMKELHDTWSRERIGYPTYENKLFNTIQRGIHLAEVPLYAGLKFGQEATELEKKAQGFEDKDLWTFAGVDPVSTIKQLVTNPTKSAERIYEAGRESIEEAVLGSTDSSKKLAGLISNAGQDRQENMEVLPDAVLNNPTASQFVFEVANPSSIIATGKAISSIPKAVKAVGQATKGIGPIAEAGKTLLGTAREIFERNHAERELGRALSIASGDTKAGTALSEGLEASKDFGLGSATEFKALNKASTPEEIAKAGGEAGGSLAFRTLNKANLAKGTNSSVAATRLAGEMSAKTGIEMAVLEDPAVTQAYKKFSGVDVSHVVAPKQYIDEIKTISSGLGPKAGAKATGVARILVDEIWKPVNNTTRNFYLSLPRTSARNLMANAELLEAQDPSAFSPIIQGQVLKQFGRRITDPKARTEIAMINDFGKTLTAGEVNDALRKYNLMNDTGRWGENISKGSKLNPLRGLEVASAVVGTPSRVASQAGDTAFKLSAALSEMKRQPDLSPESMAKVLKHVEKVAGLYSRMSSKADNVMKTATFAWSWNGYILPNLIRTSLESPTALHKYYKYESGAQALGQKNAKESDRLPLLKTAVKKFDTDKTMASSKSQAAFGSRGAAGQVMDLIERPMASLGQLVNAGGEEAAKNAAPLGARPLVALITGVDPDTDEPIDNNTKIEYDKNGAIKVMRAVGDRAKLFGYTITGPAYKAFKELYNYYGKRGEANNQVDAAKQLLMNNALQPFSVINGAPPMIFQNFATPDQQVNKRASEAAKPSRGEQSFQKKTRLTE